MKKIVRNLKKFASLVGIFAFEACGPSVIAASAPCPASTDIGGLPGMKFEDGSVGVVGPLAVNPDGTKASYTVGDHGYTYISNGMDQWNPKVSCLSENSNCGEKFREAEKGAFGPGTPEFCVYAIEVEPFSPNAKLVACGKGKNVIGNGKGRPRVGKELLDTVGGGTTNYYVSMTHLNQLVDGATQYIDSAAVPSIVVPTVKSELLGQVVYATYRGKSTFAIVADTGPSFGEGSIALHQYLHYGELRAAPKIGPIGLKDRCGPDESGLEVPFNSAPDMHGDLCSEKGKRKGAADIRAYTGIRGGVTMIVLGKAKLPMKGIVAQVPVTVEALEKAASKAGYTEASLQSMASCLARR
ncbi:hypothetical protein [Caballeronia sordidicola]|uniref:hypothetical protein n=1 Tax=Caballeronia sordidicola TaxID=196367 RepID=UPI000B314383|nr:hypothetical protein [Caballeronia sordidicola]